CYLHSSSRSFGSFGCFHITTSYVFSTFSLLISTKTRWPFATTTLSAWSDDGEAACDAHPHSHTLVRIQTPALFNSSFIFSEQTFSLLALSLRLCAFARNVLGFIHSRLTTLEIPSLINSVSKLISRPSF